MNLFDIAAKISLDSSGFEKGISSAVSMGKKAATAITTAVNEVTKIGEAAAKIVSSVSVAAAGGVAALAKNAVDEFSEYEQLVGGAELMFGDAYGYIAEKSANAYSTVQMSQNEYLQQVNGFATGLKTALGGNEQAAAELANRILQAEADIVAATGNSQEAVQNAFNGIMKSNYTMLDNLQIGITPTKEGFQEIIDKVNAWNKANGNATKYQISNLADAQSALLDYIDMIGMTGYAANEAAGTISGSTAAMRAAWKNLLIGLSDDTQDIDVLVDNFVQSAITAADNILPRVKITLSTVANLAEKYSDEAGGFVADMLVSAGEQAPELISRITSLIKTLISEIGKRKGELKTGASNLFEALIDGFEETLDEALPLAGEFVPDIVKMFLKYKTTMFKAGVQIIVELAKGLASDSDELADSAVDAVTAITGVIADNIDIVLEAGYQILESLANALLEDNPELEENSGEIVQKIVNFAVDKFPLILGLALSILKKLGEGLADSKNLETLASGATTIMGKLILELTKPENLEGLTGAALDILKGLGSELINEKNLEALLENAPTVIENLATGISNSVNKIRSGIDAIVKEIGDYLKVKENRQKLLQAGGEIGAALIEGIAMIFASLTGMGEDAAERLVNGVKQTFTDDWGIGLLEIGSALLEGSVDTAVSDLKTGVDGLKAVADATVETWNDAFGDYGTGALKIEGETPQLLNPTEPTEPTIAESLSDTISDIIIENDVGTGVSQSVVDTVFKTAGNFFESIAAVEGELGEAAFDALEKILGANIEKIILDSGQFGGSVDEAKETAAKVSEKIADYLQDTFVELPEKSGASETTNNTNINVTQNIYSSAQTAADLMQEARYEAERSVLDGLSE